MRAKRDEPGTVGREAEMYVRPGIEVLVDDGDPRIRWDGDWFVRRGVEELGGWGPPRMSTLHGFQSSGNLSFQFSGKIFWNAKPKGLLTLFLRNRIRDLWRLDAPKDSRRRVDS